MSELPFLITKWYTPTGFQEEKIVLLSEAQAEIARLRKALKSIASGCYTRENATIIAKHTLEEEVGDG